MPLITTEKNFFPPIHTLENGVEIFAYETARSKDDALPLRPRHVLEIKQNKELLLTGIESTNADLPEIVAAEISEPFNQLHIFINHHNINPDLMVEDYAAIFKLSAQAIGLPVEDFSLAMHRFPKQDEMEAVDKIQQALKL